MRVGVSYHFMFPLLNEYALKTITTVAISIKIKSSINRTKYQEPKILRLIFNISYMTPSKIPHIKNDIITGN